MSRLLHAAARGARLQAEWEGTWSGVAGIHLTPKFNYRIHPDDAHLKYGPISTALRNDALGLPLTESCWFSQLALVSDGDMYAMPSLDRSLYLLFMAEALADEGM